MAPGTCRKYESAQRAHGWVRRCRAISESQAFHKSSEADMGSKNSSVCVFAFLRKQPCGFKRQHKEWRRWLWEQFLQSGGLSLDWKSQKLWSGLSLTHFPYTLLDAIHIVATK
jgi:hypothetical protein